MPSNNRAKEMSLIHADFSIKLEQAIGSDVLEDLSRQTGLSREEILSRLSNNLPEAIDKYTPEGRIPTFA